MIRGPGGGSGVGGRVRWTTTATSANSSGIGACGLCTVTSTAPTRGSVSTSSAIRPATVSIKSAGGPATIAFAVVVSIVAVIALGLALEGWLKGEIAWPARIVIGIAALLLLWLEPAVTVVGLVVLAAGLALHALTRRKTATAAAN